MDSLHEIKYHTTDVNTDLSMSASTSCNSRSHLTDHTGTDFDVLLCNPCQENAVELNDKTKKEHNQMNAGNCTKIELDDKKKLTKSKRICDTFTLDLHHDLENMHLCSNVVENDPKKNIKAAESHNSSASKSTNNTKIETDQSHQININSTKDRLATSASNSISTQEKNGALNADSIYLGATMPDTHKDPISSGLSNDLNNIASRSFDELPFEKILSENRKNSLICTPSSHRTTSARPIFPNVPYSPYGSPRSMRRRPPRESRRVSIEQTGSFLQLNQYKLMDQIGQGSYGLVKLAYSEEDSTHYAMKILSKRKLLRQAGLMRRGPRKIASPLDRVYREIAVLKKLDHPNVVKLIEVLDDPVEDSLYMVFELVQQGEVLNIPTDKPLSEERAWSVFRETLLGLEYLHYQRIIHADLKPGNLLLTECGHVKIADLGVCNEFLGEDATMSNGSTAGTPAFRAPETLNIGQNLYCGKAADVWALGVTLFSLVFGNVPFVAKSIPVLYENIKCKSFTFPDSPKISDELKDCIQQILIKDPAKRISLTELKRHVWVTNGGLYALPSEDENCFLVQINDDDINSVVRSIPKLDTLILIKTMLKKHSFGNPFSKGVSGRAPQLGGSRLERFIRAGRSNSAPGAYNVINRQLSSENMLPSLAELGSTNEEC